MDYLKETFGKPSRKRTHIFIGISLFIIILIIIIIICSSSSGSESNSDNQKSSEDSTPKKKNFFESYINSKKYLYVWKYINADNLIKFLVDHKFSKIYLYIGCLEWDYENLINGKLYNTGDIDPKELIQKLISKNIEVELCTYLNDEVDNFENIDKMSNIAKSLAELQKSLKFTALHFDIEPQKDINLEALLHMYEECRKYIKVSAILKPGWLNKKMSSLESSFTSSEYFKKFKDCETYVDALMTVTDYSDIMAYSNKYDIIDTFLEKYEIICKRHREHVGKPILELDVKGGEDSIYYKYIEDHNNFFDYFVNISQKFDGVTIHHYTSWYKDLYCDSVEKDSIYYFGEPKQC